MSLVDNVADDAVRVDGLLDGGFLVAASNALDVMQCGIRGAGPEGLGAAMFEHCCLQWIGRVLRLAAARNAARTTSSHEPWARWFAEGQARMVKARTEREMALVRRVRSS